MNRYTVFITGANRGLGLEFARQYAADNWQVYAACRNLVQAKELQQIAHYFHNITLLQLDVTNSTQLHQLQEKCADISIDIFINTAHLYHDEEKLGNISLDNMKNMYLINAIAPLKVIEAFVDNVSKSHLKTIIALSPKTASINSNYTGGAYCYRASKAALNMIMKNLSVDLKEKNIKVFTLHPGWIDSDKLENNYISPDRSVTHMRSLLSRLTEKESGNFYDYSGNQIAW